MPYMRKGKQIFSKASGKWTLKQTAKNTGNAIKTMKLLEGLEQGTTTPKDVKFRKLTRDHPSRRAHA